MKSRWCCGALCDSARNFQVLQKWIKIVYVGYSSDNWMCPESMWRADGAKPSLVDGDTLISDARN